MTPIAQAFLRFIAAIVLNAAALILWEVGRRAPSRLVADAADAARGGRAGRAALRFFTGLLLLVAGAAVAVPAIPGRRAFAVLETGLIFAALAVEALAGPVLRRGGPSR